MYIVPKCDTDGSTFWLWWSEEDRKSEHLISGFVVRCDLSDLHKFSRENLLIMLRATGSRIKIKDETIDTIVSMIKDNIKFA